MDAAVSFPFSLFLFMKALKYLLTPWDALGRLLLVFGDYLRNWRGNDYLSFLKYLTGQSFEPMGIYIEGQQDFNS
jgi:hypothetical protein